jgi:hypothetical protein
LIGRRRHIEPRREARRARAQLELNPADNVLTSGKETAMREHNWS